MGAIGVWMGTRFVACQEAYAHDAYKQRIVEIDEEGTTRTRCFSGKPCRVIKNDTTEAWEAQELIEKIEPFSLERQGLLRAPERQAPLLSINGDQDPLVTIDDLYIISERGIVQEEWVYEGDGHCASDNASEHVPKAAAWIKTQLRRPGPS